MLRLRQSSQSRRAAGFTPRGTGAPPCTWSHSPSALASAELSWSANMGGHTVRPATLSLHPPGEENPPPWTPLTDPQPPRQKPQHYLPRQANICNHKRERKNLLGLHTPGRGCKMRCLGAPFMYLLGFSSIRPLRCHESPRHPRTVGKTLEQHQPI